MKIFKTNNEYYKWLENNPHKSIGLAPTMGNIHNAHLSLLEGALQDNDIGIISIFVNPTQFGEGEDFDNYPRTLEDDSNKIKTLQEKYPSKEIIIYAPLDKEIYPKEFNQYIEADSIAHDLEGSVRPTHFDGMVTVVNRLFEIIKPNKAYFGKKDYQQLKLVEIMARTNHPKTKIIGLPIMREENGLAMSSRNNYLNQEQKDEALALRKSLKLIAKTIKETRDLLKIQKLMATIKEDKRFNYLSIKSLKDFKDVENLNQEVVVLGNFEINNTRLLDNIEVI